MRIDSLLGRATVHGLVAGCFLVSPFAIAGGEIHRCIDAGRVTYTDRGCSEQGEVLAIASPSTVSASPREDAAAYGRATPVALGMSPRMVFDAMGRPLQTIATLEGKTLVEYWLYRGVEGRTRVAFQEGRVTRIDLR